MDLPQPFDTFRLEKKAGEYKDFDLAADSTYSLKGVTYPVDYGDIKGYVAEDGANLDVFVGKEGSIAGCFTVSRPELPEGEHKFYLNLNEAEEQSVLKAFELVIIEHTRFDTFEDLVRAMEPFRQ